MAKQNSSDGSITAAKSDQLIDYSPETMTPNFDNILGGFNGFVPEDGGKPKKQNIEAFREFIFSNVMEECTGEADSWNDIYWSVKSKMAFWRKYFCGLD